MHPPLILASTSPRRRDLITHFSLPIESISMEVNESPRPGELPDAMVRRLAQAKAVSAVRDHPEAVLIAADTTVALDDLIIGKPVDPADAVRMLRLLRGRSHRVYSGVAVRQGEKEYLQVAETIVWMRNYSDGEIDAYVATGDPLDKAAAYAIQHPIFHPVERIEGCYANVMGLPLCRVYLGLKEIGIQVENSRSVLESHLEDACPVSQALLLKSQI